MNPLILIPAHMGSNQVLDKMLADANCLMLIVREEKCALAANFAPVCVACDDVKIQEVLKHHGVDSTLTDSNLPSESDLINKALYLKDPQGAHGIIVNDQGCLPNVVTEAIKECIVLLQDPTIDITSLAMAF